MIFCTVHSCKMTSDSTCQARLAELTRYETQGARIGIVSNDRYNELLNCRTCQGEDATPQKIKRKPIGRNGGRPITVKRKEGI